MGSTQIKPAATTDGAPFVASRVEQLAIKFHRANEAFASLVDGLTEIQWTTRAVNTPGKTSAEDEDRPVGTIAHHLAMAHVAFLTRIKSAAEGTPAPIPTATLAERNAAHAARNQHPDRAQTAALLRVNGAAIVAYIAGLEEEQLDRTTDFGGRTLTTAQLIGGPLIGHIHDHELSIRATIRRFVRVVRSDEGRRFDWERMNLTLKVGAADSEERLSFFVGTIGPAEGNTILHRHREHEIFYVLAGTFGIGGELNGQAVTVTALAGDLVDIPSWEPHYWSNVGDRPGTLLTVSAPGGIEGLLGEILAHDAVQPRPGPEAYAALWAKHGHEIVTDGQ